MQGFGVGFLSKRFPDNLLIQFSIITTSLSYLVLVRIRYTCSY